MTATLEMDPPADSLGFDDLDSSQRSATDDGAYRRLVVGVVQGGRVDVAELNAALAASGRTRQEFATDCKAMKRRRDTIAALSVVQPVPPELAAIRRRVADATAELSRMGQNITVGRQEELLAVVRGATREENLIERPLRDQQRQQRQLVEQSMPAGWSDGIHASADQLRQQQNRRLDLEDRLWKLWAYDGADVRRHPDAEGVGPGLILHIQNPATPETSLARGERFAKRYGMTIDPHDRAMLEEKMQGSYRQKVLNRLRQKAALEQRRMAA